MCGAASPLRRPCRGFSFLREPQTPPRQKRCLRRLRQRRSSAPGTRPCRQEQGCAGRILPDPGGRKWGFSPSSSRLLPKDGLHSKSGSLPQEGGRVLFGLPSGLISLAGGSRRPLRAGRPLFLHRLQSEGHARRHRSGPGCADDCKRPGGKAARLGIRRLRLRRSRLFGRCLG